MVRGGHFLEGFPKGRLTGRNVNTVVRKWSYSCCFPIAETIFTQKSETFTIELARENQKKKIIVKRLGLGLGTWDLGPWTWDLGPGTWDLGIE